MKFKAIAIAIWLIYVTVNTLPAQVRNQPKTEQSTGKKVPSGKYKDMAVFRSERGSYYYYVLNKGVTEKRYLSKKQKTMLGL